MPLHEISPMNNLTIPVTSLKCYISCKISCMQKGCLCRGGGLHPNEVTPPPQLIVRPPPFLSGTSSGGPGGTPASAAGSTSAASRPGQPSVPPQSIFQKKCTQSFRKYSPLSLLSQLIFFLQTIKIFLFLKDLRRNTKTIYSFLRNLFLKNETNFGQSSFPGNGLFFF